jgi:hypothetical protein
VKHTCDSEKLQDRHSKLIWARTELRVVRDHITRDVAPQAAQAIRRALKSLDGAIRHNQRMRNKAKSAHYTVLPDDPDYPDDVEAAVLLPI